LPGTVLLRIEASLISHNYIHRSALRFIEYTIKYKMFTNSKSAILSFFMIFSVSVGLLQEQTFERVNIKYGNVIKSSPARSVRTCVDSCLQDCECRYVRFTKSSKVCQLFGEVLVYYGSATTRPSSDVVDFKKVYTQFINGKNRCLRAFLKSLNTTTLGLYYACET